VTPPRPSRWARASRATTHPPAPGEPATTAAAVAGFLCSTACHAAQIADGALSHPRRTLAHAALTAPTRPLRILLVDDTEDAAESLSLVLALESHTVAIARNGIQAVNQAREFLPSVVISDVLLPDDMDGYALARALRADPALSHVLLIAFTGYAPKDRERRAYEAGFNHYLLKPAAPETILKLLSVGAAER